MTVNEACTRCNHVGRVSGADENLLIYPRETLAADDKAFIMMVQDTVKAAVDEARVTKILDKLRKSTDKKLNTAGLPAVVKLASSSMGITVAEEDLCMNTQNTAMMERTFCCPTWRPLTPALPQGRVAAVTRTGPGLSLLALQREARKADFAVLPILSRNIQAMGKEKFQSLLFQFLYYRYYNYGLDQPFLPKLHSNLEQLRKLTGGGDV